MNLNLILRLISSSSQKRLNHCRTFSDLWLRVFESWSCILQRSRPERQVLFDWYPSSDSDARVDASMRLTVDVSFKKASRRRASKRARAGRRLSSFRRLFGPMLHPRNYTRPRTRNAYRRFISIDLYSKYILVY